MKQLFLLLALATALQACQGGADSNSETSAGETPAIAIAPENLGSISFDVEGMTCTGCESAVERSVKSMEGVAEVKASHETGKTTVQFDKTIVDAGALEASIESTGYKVKGYSPDN